MSKDAEEFGYLKASVENNTKMLSSLSDMMKGHMKEEREKREELQKELTEIKEDINLYKTVIKIMKALAGTAVFILAFKFGDIADLWEDGK